MTSIDDTVVAATQLKQVISSQTLQQTGTLDPRAPGPYRNVCIVCDFLTAEQANGNMLQQENQSLMADNLNFSARINELTMLNGNLNMQVTQATQQVSDMRNQIEMLNTQIDALKAQLAAQPSTPSWPPGSTQTTPTKSPTTPTVRPTATTLADLKPLFDHKGK